MGSEKGGGKLQKTQKTECQFAKYQQHFFRKSKEGTYFIALKELQRVIFREQDYFLQL